MRKSSVVQAKVSPLNTGAGASVVSEHFKGKGGAGVAAPDTPERCAEPPERTRESTSKCFVPNGPLVPPCEVDSWETRRSAPVSIVLRRSRMIGG